MVFRGLPFNVEMEPSCLKHMNSVLSELMYWPITLCTPGYTTDIQLEPLYLQEVLNFLHVMYP